MLFAAHRELAGQKQLDIEMPYGSTADDLYERLQEQSPRLGDLRNYTTFAVNRETVDPGTQLRDGDEVALLQPVSGGCHD